MKKLFCILFCLIFTTFALVGCGDVERDEWLGQGTNEDGNVVGGKYDGYPTVSEIPDIAINLYIIVEDSTLDKDLGAIIINDDKKLGEITQSINTVNNAIKDFTSTKYHTEVNVVYVKASDYDSVVLGAVKNGTANIVLVNSSTLMQDLYATGKLCSLDSYLATDKYGTLNTSIPSALLEASKIDSSLYTIPNNHVIGEYEYLLINKDMAMAAKISEDQALALNSYETAVAAFNLGGVNKVSAEMVSLVSGSYEDRFLFEAQGYYCNVVKNPIADKNEAFASAFAIIDHNTPNGKVDINERSMEIIYGINTNVTLRNLLQYGVAGTNYTLGEEEGVIEELVGGSNRYDMNLIFTGDIMYANYCDQIGWNAEAKENAIAQNSDSQNVEIYAPSTEEE